MSIIRVNKTKDYSVMSNYHLRDKNLSLKAKGLLSIMLSLPENWDYSIAGLSAINQEGIKAIRSALQELENFGYLVRTRTQLENGQFDYIYDIYEMPKPYDRKRYTVNGNAENCTQYNKDKTNKEINNNIDSKEENIKRMFDEFWNLYPRKVDKQGSYKAYKNIKHLDEEHPKILDSIETLKKSRQWQTMEYIPHPTTFIHQRRWEGVVSEETSREWFENYWDDIIGQTPKPKKYSDEEIEKWYLEKFGEKVKIKDGKIVDEHIWITIPNIQNNQTD